MLLAQLVGGQTLPNLLGVAVLKPDKVLQLRSGDGSFKRAARDFERAVASVHPGIKVETRIIDRREPHPEDVISVLNSLPANTRPHLFNLTGGTKLMFLGAAQWADLNHIPAFYVDTSAHEIVWVHHKPDHASPPLAEAVAKLTLPQLLMAAGVPETKVEGTVPTESMREFGRVGIAAWQKKGAILSRWLDHTRDEWTRRGARPSPVAIPLDALELAEAAAAAGFASIGGSRLFIPRAFELDTHGQTQSCQTLIKQLQGGWFELHVAGEMMGTPHFTDLRWSVEAHKEAQLGLGETDIVAVDRRSLSLVFVSCKVSSTFEKPLEHIFALQHRAVRFGGSHAKAILCVWRVNDDGERDRIEAFCRACRVQVLFGHDEIRNWLGSSSV